MKTPAEVVQAAFNAINLDDWGTLADLSDPVSLRLFKEETLDQATATFRRFGNSAQEIFEPEGDDVEDDLYSGFIDPEECLSRELFNVRTLEQLRDMDPGRVFARWIQAKSCRHYHLLDFTREEWQEQDAFPSLKTAHMYNFVVLGWVNDGADLAHVLYRNDRDIPRASIAPEPECKSGCDEDDELKRILCVRSFPMPALCRRQPDGSWRLIASRTLYLVPEIDLIDAG